MMCANLTTTSAARVLLNLVVVNNTVEDFPFVSNAFLLLVFIAEVGNCETGGYLVLISFLGQEIICGTLRTKRHGGFHG